MMFVVVHVGRRTKTLFQSHKDNQSKATSTSVSKQKLQISTYYVDDQVIYLTGKLINQTDKTVVFPI